MHKIKKDMKNRINTRLLTGLAFLSLLPLNSKGQVSLTLDEVIRLCQDSAITAFQSQQEFQSQQASYEAFEALRKPQLSLKVLPNYSHYVSDPTRDYVYLRNYDIFSTAANLRLTQKVLPFGGEAYVGTQAIWSEYFRKEASGYPRQFVATPLLVGYSHDLLGYNPFGWEKKVEDQRLKAARCQHEYDLRLLAEEAAVRYFRLACKQRVLQMRLLAELHSIEVQQQNAANQVEVARRDEQNARTELASLLRLEQLPADLALLSIPDIHPPVSYTSEEVVKLALSNSPAYQHQLAELTEARHQEYKARKERGINVGLDVNLGMQQVNNTFGSAFKNQQLYALGSVQFSIPLMDHGAAKKRHEKATAWANRQELASQEVERLLAEDAAVTLQKLQSSRDRLTSTEKTIKLAEKTYNETADNYANGLSDINTFTLAESRWATAYTNYLTALEEFWVNHYHLQTLINYE